MKVGYYQCECRPGDYPANIAKVIRGLEFAQGEPRPVLAHGPSDAS